MLTAILTSWKTSLIGLILVVLGAVMLMRGETSQSVVLITAGLGFIQARDADKSSEDSGVTKSAILSQK